jgi:hypothetical protein
MKLLSTCLALLLGAAMAADVEEGTTGTNGTDAQLLPGKQVMFFAGPHQSSEEGIEEFFHQWISSAWRHGHPNLLALRYWR